MRTQKKQTPNLLPSLVRGLLVVVALGGVLWLGQLLFLDNTVQAAPPAQGNACLSAQKHSLPLPHSIPPNGIVAYEQQIFQFLDSAQYKALKWCSDKYVRDTGPFVNGQQYGTHPAVRIFYSPEMITWLMNGRTGTIPDGAMIIKEQYPPPAARYAGMTDAELDKAWIGAKDWTIMLRDATGSHDGWYWGEFYTGMTFDNDAFPYNYPTAGFGQYCVRCHASAADQSTFSSLDNIKGFPGDPLTFRVDNSWRAPADSSRTAPARVFRAN